MSAKASAIALVVLILLPFSAPFSTCDLATLRPAIEHVDGQTQPTGPTPLASALGSHARDDALPAGAHDRLRGQTALTLPSRPFVATLPSVLFGAVATPLHATSVASIPLRI